MFISQILGRYIVLNKTKMVTLAVIATFVNLASATSAFAVVTYSYNRPGLGSFVYEAPNFITTYTNADPAVLTSCSIIPTFGTCDIQSFRPDNSLFGGPTHDAVVIFRGTNNGTFLDYFGVGAFSAFGTYNDTLLNNGAVLTVSNGALPVPEPASWPIVLTGVVALGTALRVRHNASTNSTI